jgi:hypothetical protein
MVAPMAIVHRILTLITAPFRALAALFARRRRRDV